MLYAKIRSARSYSFKPKTFAKLVLPETTLYQSDLVELEQEEHLVLLVKRASKKEKYEWLARHNRPFPYAIFFRQHFWIAISGEETVLALEGFLEPLEMGE